MTRFLGLILGGFGLLLLAKTARASSPNLSAFLSVIRKLESNNDYSAYVYGGTISNFADHPIATGEFTYRFNPEVGKLTSAAGAYQIVFATWQNYRGSLPDFSPASQDACAVSIIDGAGMLRAVEAGDIETVVDGLRLIWVSLDKAGAARVRSLFESFGGSSASA